VILRFGGSVTQSFRYAILSLITGTGEMFYEGKLADSQRVMPMFHVKDGEEKRCPDKQASQRPEA
jgi:hypothetical protein